MTSILGSGDPAFYHSEAQQAEVQRELQSKHDDMILSDGRVLCYWCEEPHDLAEMSDYERDGFVWKVCVDCGYLDA